MNKLMAALFVLAQASLLAQGTLSFRTTIVGYELSGQSRASVRGEGSLSLAGSTLFYDISVPLRRVHPVEAHFHGPSVGGENAQFSLASFQDNGSFIRYTGALPLEQRWLPDVIEGKWYINLHSPQYENGILSGYVMPIPEPGLPSLALLCGGAALAAAARKGARARGPSWETH